MFFINDRPHMKDLLQAFLRHLSAMGIDFSLEWCKTHFRVEPRGENARISQGWVQNMLTQLLSYAFQEAFVFDRDGVAKTVGPCDRDKRTDERLVSICTKSGIYN